MLECSSFKAPLPLPAVTDYGGVAADWPNDDFRSSPAVEPVARRSDDRKDSTAIERLAVRGDIDIVLRHETLDGSCVFLKPRPVPGFVKTL